MENNFRFRYAFLTKDNFDYNSSLNEIGQKIFKTINKSNDIYSVETFIENSVLKVDNKKLNEQKKILNDLNFLNKNNKLASENIFNFIEKSKKI